VGDIWQSEKDFHPAAQLFLEFPVERLLGSLSRVDFPARKLPETRKMFAWGTAGDEELGLGRIPNEGADDGDRGHWGRFEWGLGRLKKQGLSVLKS